MKHSFFPYTLQGTTTHQTLSRDSVITPMTGTITRALNWDNVYEQQFIAVTPMGDEVLLYQTNHEDPGIESNSMLKLYSRSGFENIQCSSYSDINKGIVGVGLSMVIFPYLTYIHQTRRF